MATSNTKKRSHTEAGAKRQVQRPNKKQKKQQEYHSDTDEDESFQPVNLLESDDDEGLDAAADDGGDFSDSSAESGSEIESSSDTEGHPSRARQSLKKQEPKTSAPKQKYAQDVPPSSDEEDDSDGSDDDSFGIGSGAEDEDQDASSSKKAKSKRNDPNVSARILQACPCCD